MASRAASMPVTCSVRWLEISSIFAAITSVISIPASCRSARTMQTAARGGTWPTLPAWSGTVTTPSVGVCHADRGRDRSGAADAVSTASERLPPKVRAVGSVAHYFRFGISGDGCACGCGAPTSSSSLERRALPIRCWSAAIRRARSGALPSPGAACSRLAAWISSFEKLAECGPSCFTGPSGRCSGTGLRATLSICSAKALIVVMYRHFPAELCPPAFGIRARVLCDISS